MRAAERGLADHLAYDVCFERMIQTLVLYHGGVTLPCAVALAVEES